LNAFTYKANGPLRQLICSCDVHDIGAALNGTHINTTRFRALWDTGATGSVISKNVAAQLALPSAGPKLVYHGGGSHTVNTYDVNIYLPNNAAIPNVTVSEGILQGFDVIIGMDIITLGDFSLTHVNGKTCFSFRMPSIKEIDYVSEAAVIKKPPLSWRKGSKGRKGR
jgi:hypothetical protein